MNSLDALREARRASLDDLDLGEPRDRLDAELATATPRRTAAVGRMRRPLVLGTGLLAAAAATAAIVALVAGGTTAPEPRPEIGNEPPTGVLLTDAPDLRAVAGKALQIRQTTSEVEYLQDATGQFMRPAAAIQNRTNATGAYECEYVEEYLVPGDDDADARIRITRAAEQESASGGDDAQRFGAAYVTGYYGDESRVVDALTNWLARPPVTESTVDEEVVPAADRADQGLTVPGGSLFKQERATLPTSEAGWVDYWQRNAPNFGDDADPRMAALASLEDSVNFALAEPETRVLVVNALTQVPGMEWTRDGSTVVFEAAGRGTAIEPRPEGHQHLLRVTVDLDRAVITDYEDFYPSPESPLVPADVADIHIRTEIDSEAPMPTG